MHNGYDPQPDPDKCFKTGVMIGFVAGCLVAIIFQQLASIVF